MNHLIPTIFKYKYYTSNQKVLILTYVIHFIKRFLLILNYEKYTIFICI